MMQTFLKEDYCVIGNHVLYQMVPLSVTLNELEGHLSYIVKSS